MLTDDERDFYDSLSRKIRKKTLQLIYRTKSPHIGSSFSIVELLIALYFKVLNIDPINPFYPNRDRFILSKGHGCPALYSILEERGFLSPEYLLRFAVNDGVLEQHPNIDIKRGIEVTTGSLGHGLSIGVGIALAAMKDCKGYKVYVLLSDGELNEGSVWEAAMFAAKHKLDNLVAIIDYNKIQALGYTKDIVQLEPLTQKWTSFGWSAMEIDGHNFGQIFKTFGNVPFESHKPNVIIAHTIKGKGVSFMEDKLIWHYRCPDDNEYKKAIEELS
ncbi:MAG: transketolase [Acidobacteriota bacterium]|nr:transketolase [Acidobacteriota bacterium]